MNEEKRLINTNTEMNQISELSVKDHEIAIIKMF